MSIGRWVCKGGVYMYRVGCYLFIKSNVCSNVDRPRDYHASEAKSGERQIPYGIFCGI